MDFDSADKILDFAIGKEEEAAAFYTDLAGKMTQAHMKETFLSFAQEEKGHRAKLQAVKDGKELTLQAKSVQDLKIGDYLIDVEPSPDMTYQQALNVAMKAEKAAFKLYHDLAQKTNVPKLKELFLALAQEEARHKLRFEIEYDEMILTEN
jgi:rubrerythrin